MREPQRKKEKCRAVFSRRQFTASALESRLVVHVWKNVKVPRRFRPFRLSSIAAAIEKGPRPYQARDTIHFKNDFRALSHPLRRSSILRARCTWSPCEKTWTRWSPKSEEIKVRRRQARRRTKYRDSWTLVNWYCSPRYKIDEEAFE